jgi:hypothetical protein
VLALVAVSFALSKDLAYCYRSKTRGTYDASKYFRTFRLGAEAARYPMAMCFTPQGGGVMPPPTICDPAFGIEINGCDIAHPFKALQSLVYGASV